MPTEHILEIEVWSDVVCPWCYVGKRRLETALTQFEHGADVQVTWRSFELDPAAPRSYEGQGTYAERLARKYGTTVPQAQLMIDRMVVTAAGEGLTFDFERAQTGNTFDAHRLLHFAATKRQQDALKERLLRACFTDGQSIAEVDTLVRLAGEAGLDADEARTVLVTQEFSHEVRADEARARQLGISGVPFFVLGSAFGVSGAQPAEVLVEALNRAWARGQTTNMPVGPACGVDGC